ncbi:hypothetical protein HDU97_006843 [Phlyctochytrium planicorne]|nr:hypothetical protein HDU97_006843 [Phlyctochytrium planicorne]
MLVLCLGDLHIPHRAVDLPPKFKKLLVPGKIHQILCTGNLTTHAVYTYLRTVSSSILSVLGDFDDLSSSPPIPPSTAPPLSRTIDCGAIKIGLIHGHTVLPWGDRKALQAVARGMDVDVLVSGHTHRFEAWEDEGRFFVNPGSATGAFSGFIAPLASAVKEEVKAEEKKEDAAKAAEEKGEGEEKEPEKEEKEKVEKKVVQPSVADEVVPSFVLMDIQGVNVVLYVYRLINGDVKVEKLEFSKRAE